MNFHIHTPQSRGHYDVWNISPELHSELSHNMTQKSQTGCNTGRPGWHYLAGRWPSHPSLLPTAGPRNTVPWAHRVQYWISEVVDWTLWSHLEGIRWEMFQASNVIKTKQKTTTLPCPFKTCIEMEHYLLYPLERVFCLVNNSHHRVYLVFTHSTSPPSLPIHFEVLSKPDLSLKRNPGHLPWVRL